MNCREIAEHLMDVAAGLAPDPLVAAHLRTCAACTERLDGLRQTMALLDEWKAPEPSPYFGLRLSARLREEVEAPPQGWFAWLRQPALAAAVAVLLVVGSMLYRTGDGADPATQVAVQAQPGTAVGDLQELDRNHDLFANFDLLDDLGPEWDAQQQTVNP
ncbi:MAG: anti-sigma factor [Terriglobales bacterium]